MNLVLYGNPIRTLVFFGLMLISFIFGLYLSMTRVHKRQFMTLFNSEASVRWQRIAKGFGVFLGLEVIRFFVWYLIAPSRYTLSFNASEWLPYTLLSVVFLPIFSLFRVLLLAYLLQGIGLVVRSPLLLLLLWGLMMGSLSYASEPETLFYGLVDAIISMFFAWVIINDNGVELILGSLAASYLINFAWVSLDDPDYFNPPTIFKASEPASPLYSLVTALIQMALFYYICFDTRRNLSGFTPEE